MHLLTVKDFDGNELCCHTLVDGEDVEIRLLIPDDNNVVIYTNTYLSYPIESDKKYKIK